MRVPPFQASLIVPLLLSGCRSSTEELRRLESEARLARFEADDLVRLAEAPASSGGATLRLLGEDLRRRLSVIELRLRELREGRDR